MQPSDSGVPEEEVQPTRGRSKVIILIVVALVFGALIGAKLGSSRQLVTGTSAAQSGPAKSAAGGQSTNVVAAYDAAAAQGKPIFVQFGKES